jgi:hypothetical protein
LTSERVEEGGKERERKKANKQKKKNLRKTNKR